MPHWQFTDEKPKSTGKIEILNSKSDIKQISGRRQSESIFFLPPRGSGPGGPRKSKAFKHSAVRPPLAETERANSIHAILDPKSSFVAAVSASCCNSPPSLLAGEKLEARWRVALLSMVRKNHNVRRDAASDQDKIGPIQIPNSAHICKSPNNVLIRSLNFNASGHAPYRSQWCARAFSAAVAVGIWVSAESVGGLPLETSEGGPLFSSPINLTDELRLPPVDAPDSAFLYESGAGAQPSFAFESITGNSDYQSGTDFAAASQPLVAFESSQATPPGDSSEVNPVETPDPNAVVPYLLPVKPFPPRFSGLSSASGIASESEDFDELFPPPAEENPLRYAFFGPQSDNVQIENCQHFDAFLVSPLPSSLASRFKDFVQKEAGQEDGTPFLHHIHGQAALDPANREENPRLIVEGGKVTPLWSENADDNPVFRMDEGTATLIRLVAPIRSAYDEMASMLLMPIINVNMAYGDGLLLSYKVSGSEGKLVDHQHQDGIHRPVAELDVVYKSCFSVGGDSSEPITVRAELRLDGCEPVVLTWKVICSSSALLQGNCSNGAHFLCIVPLATEVPQGFHVAIGPLTPTANAGGSPALRDSADVPFDPRLVASPTVADIRAITSKEGDIVANGEVAQEVSSVQSTSVAFDPSQDFVELYVWCRGCKEGKLDMNIPTIAADLQVMFPLLYNYLGTSKANDKSTERGANSLVATRQSSHIALREALPGSEENVRRFVLQFQCKSEGESIVTLDFPFHAYRDIQVFFKKQCAAPAAASLRDPSCSSGTLSEDGSACCLASCGKCGGDGCEDREGGLVGCCLTHIHSSALPCSASTAPCVMTTQKNKMNREIRMALVLPKEEMSQHFNIIFAPLWLFSMSIYLLKFLLWSLVTAAVLVYMFAIYYGVHVLKEPFSVAIAPSSSQFLNALFLLGGHVGHLYKTRGGMLFGDDGFHSYTPFEERAPGNARKLSSANDPFYSITRWRSNEDGPSFIRLTSFNGNLSKDESGHMSEGLQPMEFCDVEAGKPEFKRRDAAEDKVLWDGIQEGLHSDYWDEYATGMLVGTEEYKGGSNNRGQGEYEEFCEPKGQKL
ncbi:uncharacterized protein LOC34617814 [Cyclospora cayetanensis]|uniref:Uncharacterized protein LOC34617814 n=1 Tax=Cyclospora cayetanensis TaxID=88456 RepID=A0A6P6RZ36_9EIME|nr:uncharacterized protein LOC34617814 [Cyclospora cayetanensis]